MTKTEYVTLSVSDGTSMRAYVAHPAGKPRAGLLVFQEAFGVNAHIRDVTERFAGEGYLSISPELFHRTAPGLEAGYTDFPAVMPHMQALTDAGLAADIEAAYQWLKNGEAKTLPVGATHRDSRRTHGSDSVRRLLLWRWHRAGRHVPQSGRSSERSEASDPIFLGWAGRPHRSGCGAGRHQRTQRG
jgi:hypothetical protein